MLVIAWADPAGACMSLPTPFSYMKKYSDLVIEAKAVLRASDLSDTEWKGEVDFRRIRCLKRPAQMKRCPSSLTVAFEQHYDGYNCGHALDGSRLGPLRDKYFFLDSRDGAWHIADARRRRYSDQ
jgi:hypothetical protein